MGNGGRFDAGYTRRFDAGYARRLDAGYERYPSAGCEGRCGFRLVWGAKMGAEVALV